MKCDKCKKIIHEDVTYCPFCGNNLDVQKINKILASGREISISKIIMSVVIVLMIVVSIYYMITGLHNELTVLGNWRCADYTSNLDVKDKNNYYFDFIFEEDGSFKQFSLNNSKVSFEIIGNYSESLNDKTSEETSGYLDVYLGVKSVTKDGVTEDVDVTSHYDVGILSNKSSALIINTQNYSAYYCERY